MKVANTLLSLTSLFLTHLASAQDPDPGKSLTYPQTVECSAKAAYMVQYASANPSVQKFSPVFVEVESKAISLARIKGAELNKDLQVVGTDIRRASFELAASISTAEGDLRIVRHKQIEQDVWKGCAANGLVTRETLLRVTK